MGVWAHGCMDVYEHGCIGARGRMDVWSHGCMGVWARGHMDAWACDRMDALAHERIMHWGAWPRGRMDAWAHRGAWVHGSMGKWACGRPWHTLLRVEPLRPTFPHTHAQLLHVFEWTAASSSHHSIAVAVLYGRSSTAQPGSCYCASNTLSRARTCIRPRRLPERRLLVQPGSRPLGSCRSSCPEACPHVTASSALSSL